MPAAVEPRYDPYDVAINADPYPHWKRLRDEAPLYFDEQHDFYALSRHEDVERALVNWGTFSSARSPILELIQANIEFPAGITRGAAHGARRTPSRSSSASSRRRHMRPATSPRTSSTTAAPCPRAARCCS